MIQVIDNGPTGTEEHIVATVSSVAESQSIIRQLEFEDASCWCSLRNVGSAPRPGEWDC